MKGDQKKATLLTKRTLAIEAWMRLRRPTVGARELRAIQSDLAKRFGKETVESPASIARWLADEGAELRHPEVIEFDAKWRDKELKELEVNELIEGRASARPLTLRSASTVLRRFENSRKRITNDEMKLRSLRELALNEKASAQLLARDDAISKQMRAVQAEIAEWFRIWLQTPELFNYWLELRQRSSEFRKRFAIEKDR